MSSLVVWLELMRYVWKPSSPTMDQTEKKHTTASSTLAGLSLIALRNPVCCEPRDSGDQTVLRSYHTGCNGRHGAAGKSCR